VEPSTVRTDQDRVMICLGVALFLFFLVAGYITLTRSDKQPANNKIRGPVKNPNRSSSFLKTPKGPGNFRAHPVFAGRFVEHLPLSLIRHRCSDHLESSRRPTGLISYALPKQNLPQFWNKSRSDGLTGISMPLPDETKKEQILLYRISRETGSSKPQIFCMRHVFAMPFLEV
jgi:hypothetical protein